VDGTEEKAPHVRVVDRRWWARESSPEGTQGGEDLGARKPAYVEELEERIAHLGTQLQQLTEERRRAADEFDQSRQRLRREQAREVERGKRAVITALLEVGDNLDRAVAAGRDVLIAHRTESDTSRTGDPQGNPAETLARGVELVRDQFLAVLQGFGVTKMAALDQPFDAERHEAVTTTPVNDPARDGMVVAVLKEGYSIGDEILRPASVVVGRVAEG
jgi:molecular chaperone GrpE